MGAIYISFWGRAGRREEDRGGVAVYEGEAAAAGFEARVSVALEGPGGRD